MENTKRENKEAFIVAATEAFGENAVLTRVQVVDIVESKKLEWPHWLVNNKSYRVSRGVYKLPVVGTFAPKPKAVKVPKAPKAPKEAKKNAGHGKLVATGIAVKEAEVG